MGTATFRHAAKPREPSAGSQVHRMTVINASDCLYVDICRRYAGERPSTLTPSSSAMSQLFLMPYLRTSYTRSRDVRGGTHAYHYASGWRRATHHRPDTAT